MNRIPTEPTLSDRARRRMRAELSAYLDLYQAGRVRSPFFISALRVVPAFGVSLLTIGLTSAGLAYASGTALPGEPLYPVKTVFVEPTVAALQNTPEEKESWRQEVTERRLSEATELAAKNKLDTKTRTIIDAAVKTQAVRMNALADKHGATGNQVRELALRSELEARLAGHERVLDELFERLPKDSSAAKEVKELRNSIEAEHERMTEKRRFAELVTERRGVPVAEAVTAALMRIEASERQVRREAEGENPLKDEVGHRMEYAKKLADYARKEVESGSPSGNAYVRAEEGVRAAREAAIFATWGKLVRDAEIASDETALDDTAIAAQEVD